MSTQQSSTTLVEGAVRESNRMAKPRSYKWIAPTLYIFF